MSDSKNENKTISGQETIANNENGKCSRECDVYSVVVLIVSIIIRAIYNMTYYVPGVMLLEFVRKFEDSSRPLVNSVGAVYLGLSAAGSTLLVFSSLILLYALNCKRMMRI